MFEAGSWRALKDAAAFVLGALPICTDRPGNHRLKDAMPRKSGTTFAIVCPTSSGKRGAARSRIPKVSR
jgi:hypothetical protein